MLTTPQKKSWLSLTPRSENPKSSSGNPRIGDSNGAGKGKGAAVLEPSSSPASGGVYGIGGIIAVEGGDPVALLEKVSKLENELFEYQYNMGLLLMEKKELSFKNEDLQQALAEAKNALKREQAAHLIAISSVEKREENLRKALGVEKQCVIDLEKALHVMRAEYADIKFTADSKLAEVNALSISNEEKLLEVEVKLREAASKHAEASRRSSDVERKKQDLYVRESALKRACLSFDSEREAHESSLSKQREDLHDWEKKLQEGEERMYESQRILNQWEERVNEVERRYKEKENDLEEAQKKIDMGNKELENTEEEINSKLKSLKEKEKDEAAGVTSGGLHGRTLVATTFVEDTLMSEVMNGTPDGHVGYSDVTPGIGGNGENSFREAGEEDDDEEEEEEEALHPVGKKLWTFLTT